MVRIEPGKFKRGSGDDDEDARADEKPSKEIRITRAFLLGKYEVTQAQYLEVMGKNPSAFSAKGRHARAVKGLDTRSHPVESVSWLDAVRFCNRLSERHGLRPYYAISDKVVTIRRDGTGYRLPTEAEWEYACRAGTRARWSCGERREELKKHAWFADNSGLVTHPVGKKKPNAWGLFDMHGNVPEWCWDRYGGDSYRVAEVSDPAGPGTGATRVYRGGGWNSEAGQVRSAARNSRGTTYDVLTIVGLRVARDAE
jgi:formylglycine-generating enzyme required for sulfatase activity